MTHYAYSLISGAASLQTIEVPQLIVVLYNRLLNSGWTCGSPM